jgi:iron complex outermembrane receptor protein
LPPAARRTIRQPRAAVAALVRAAWLVVVLGLCPVATGLAQQDLAQIGLEELSNLQVMSASRKLQRVQETAAAVFVVTREDIARSGANSVPEALRLVPGMQVAQAGARRWAVSARGDNGRFAGRLQVLLDGRSIYTPLFSGVFWEHEDLLLEDVERIEVIRGPGAAMWGANAMNGVINIITRRARDTLGTLISATAGDPGQGILGVRHGMQIGGDGFLRLWAKGRITAAAPLAGGGEGYDDAKSRAGGFKFETPIGEGNRLTVIGGSTHADTDELLDFSALFGPQARFGSQFASRENYLLGRWESALHGGGEMTLQASITGNRLNLELAGVPLSEKRTTLDIDFQHRLAPIGRHDVLWGLALRETRDEVALVTPIFAITPERRRITLASAFLHDEYTLVPERWKLIGGLRAENSNVGGFELQPNARMLWTPTPDQTVWASVAKATRKPSRAQIGLDIALGPLDPGHPLNQAGVPLVIQISGREESQESEKAVSVELGWRGHVAKGLALDVSAFHTRYRDRLTLVPVSFAPLQLAPPLFLARSELLSIGRSRSRGAEVSAEWQAATHWRIQAAYSRLLKEDPNASPVGLPFSTSDLDPRWQGSLWSSWNLGPAWKLDVLARRVGPIERIGLSAYTAVDARLAWQPRAGLELALVGQNLFDPQHPEIISDALPAVPLEVPRRVLFKAKLQF